MERVYTLIVFALIAAGFGLMSHHDMLWPIYGISINQQPAAVSFVAFMGLVIMWLIAAMIRALVSGTGRKPYHDGTEGGRNDFSKN